METSIKFHTNFGDINLDCVAEMLRSKISATNDTQSDTVLNIIDSSPRQKQILENL